jgi:hypothetical protein
LTKNLSTQKIVAKLSENMNWIWDPEKKPIPDPDPGVKIALDPGAATLLPKYTF